MCIRDSSKIEEQKKAVRAGYDMDIIPADLATYGSEAKKLLQDLQSRNERMFLLTFLVLNTADNPRPVSYTHLEVYKRQHGEPLSGSHRQPGTAEPKIL